MPRSISPAPLPGADRITRTLIDLVPLSKAHRVLVAGHLGTEILIALHRRGCTRVATTSCCGAPHGQYDAALVGWHGQSLQALEATLDWLVRFLGPRSVLAVWVGCDDGAPDRKLRSMLTRLGFRVEVGTACESGLAVAARRIESMPAAKAA
jgi:hypothetical protein